MATPDTTHTHRRQRANPFSGLRDVVNEMSRGWDLQHGPSSAGQTQPRSHVDAWIPSADIAAVNEQLVIYVALPGVNRDEVEVTYTAPTLTIAGQRHLQVGDERQATYHTKELSWGRFRRSFTLPDGIGSEDLRVAFTGGLLIITVAHYADTEDPAQLSISGDQPTG